MFITLENNITINTNNIESVVTGVVEGTFFVHFVSGTRLTIQKEQFDTLMEKINGETLHTQQE